MNDKEKEIRHCWKGEKGIITKDNFSGTTISSEIFKLLGINISVWDILFKRYAVLPFGNVGKKFILNNKPRIYGLVKVFHLGKEWFVLVEID